MKKKQKPKTVNSYQVVLASTFETVSVSVVSKQKLSKVDLHHLQVVKRHIKRMKEYASILFPKRRNFVNESFFLNNPTRKDLGGKTLEVTCKTDLSCFLDRLKLDVDKGICVI